MAPSIALLSHRGGNIGHDFMALGMTKVVRAAFGDAATITHFEQHRPFEVYSPGHWLRLFNRLRPGRDKTIRRMVSADAFRDWAWQRLPDMPFNLAIACGGPNIVPGASKTSEMKLLLHHMNGAFRQRGVPFIDAGVGAAFPLEGTQQLTDGDDVKFYKEAFGYADHVTVRDVVAAAVCRDLNFAADLVPCAAFATGRVFERAKRNDDEGYVLINFQRLGANTDWGQGVDPELWRSTVRAVAEQLGQRHQVRFLAQNNAEAMTLRLVAPDFPCDAPTDVESYAASIAGAKVGFVSRIHAAIPLAGIGVPSLVVGTDTRLGAVEQIGLPTIRAKNASASAIIDRVEALIQNAQSERERLIDLREKTVKQYAEIFQRFIK